MNEKLIKKDDGYYDKFGNWYPKHLIENKREVVWDENVDG